MRRVLSLVYASCVAAMGMHDGFSQTPSAKDASANEKELRKAACAWIRRSEPIIYSFLLSTTDPIEGASVEATGRMSYLGEGVVHVCAESASTNDGEMMRDDKRDRGSKSTVEYYRSSNSVVIARNDGTWKRLLLNDCRDIIAFGAGSLTAQPYSRVLMAALGESPAQVAADRADLVKATVFYRDPRGEVTADEILAGRVVANTTQSDDKHSSTGGSRLFVSIDSERAHSLGDVPKVLSASVVFHSIDAQSISGVELRFHTEASEVNKEDQVGFWDVVLTLSEVGGAKENDIIVPEVVSNLLKGG